MKAARILCVTASAESRRNTEADASDVHPWYQMRGSWALATFSRVGFPWRILLAVWSHLCWCLRSSIQEAPAMDQVLQLLAAWRENRANTRHHVCRGSWRWGSGLVPGGPESGVQTGGAAGFVDSLQLQRNV